MPDWVDLVKLGKHKELAPSDENWFYIRAGKSKDYSKIPLSFLFYLHSKRVFYLGVKCLLSKRMHSFSTCCFHHNGGCRSAGWLYSAQSVGTNL